MPNDNALPKFLYAILKQKDLKDIDWEAVAKDPVLDEPISKGHAARMRWTRFRDAMRVVDGTTPARKPREPKSPKSPRRTRVEKSKSPKKEQRKMSLSPESIKFESTPEMTPDVISRQGTIAPAIKSERRESEMPATPPPPSQGPQPLSYLESPITSPSPGQSQNMHSFSHGIPDINDTMTHSFNMPGYDLETPMIGGGYTGMSPLGMGMGMPLEGSYPSWANDGPPHEMGADAGFHVKKESNWDEAPYRL